MGLPAGTGARSVAGSAWTGDDQVGFIAFRLKFENEVKVEPPLPAAIGDPPVRNQVDDFERELGLLLQKREPAKRRAARS